MELCERYKLKDNSVVKPHGNLNDFFQIIAAEMCLSVAKVTCK